MKYRKVSAMQMWKDKGQDLRIVARGEDGKRYDFVKKGLASYFFVDEEPHYSPELSHMVKSIEGGFKSLYGTPLWKVTTWKSRDTNALREGFNHYEADILWVERACIDMKLTDGFRWENEDVIVDNEVDHIKMRIWTLDIEVGAKIFDEAQYKNPVGFTACIVVWDNYDEKYYEFRLDEYNNEVDLFNGFVRFLREKDPDLITGWNIEYDVSWIMARMEKLKMDIRRLSNYGRAAIRHWTSPDGKVITKFDIGGRIIFDGLQAYKKKINPSGQLSSYSLKSIAIAEGFEPWEDLGAQIYDLWDTRADDIVKYCKKDVEATRFIIEKEQLVELSLLICRFSCCTMEQTSSKDKIIDHAMLLRRGDRILPSKRRRFDATDDDRLKGAVVLSPKPGMHKGLGVFDAAALYPSIIREFNISPETKNEEGDIVIKSLEGNTYRFTSKEKQVGLLSEVLNEFIDLREHYRELKREAGVKFGHDSKEYINYEQTEYAVKFINTSVYGVNGFKQFRLFDLDCANAITAVGRKVIVAMRDGLKDKGFPVEYGDTDSVFIQVGDVSNGEKVGDIIKEIIDNTLSEMGVRGDGISVKFEKYFEWVIFKQRKINAKEKKEIRNGDIIFADTNISNRSYAPKFIGVKKKYVGYCTWSEGKDGKMEKDDYLYIRGFETRRSDANPFLKKCMEKYFELLKPGDINVCTEYLREIKKMFFELSYREIAWPRRVDTPDANNPHARGVRYGIEKLKWTYDIQTAPQLLYIKRVVGHPNTDVICIQTDLTLPEGFEVDYPTMFNKVIKKKFEPILDSLGLNWDVELEGQKTLMDWV